MLIYRCLLGDDKDLKGKNAVYHPDLAEIWAVNRAYATWELNNHGFRIIQFLHDNNSYTCGEWVLVERFE